MRTQFTDEASIQKVISEMTLEEKIGFIAMAHPSTNSISEVPDMRIPALQTLDGATGVNGTNRMLDFIYGNQAGEVNTDQPWGVLQNLIAMEPEAAEAAAKGNEALEAFVKYMRSVCNPEGKYICFPSGVNVGACFDPEAARRIGRAVGQEMWACHVDICFGPNVDIMREPLGGRNYEMYGEDPVLVGETATAFIQGMQSTGTAACAKHFMANNQETRRTTKDTHVSKRTLRELYAQGFEKAVKKAGVKAVMSAYNAVNGQFSSYNKEFLTDWLKEEWGFDGLLFSDSGAVSGNNDKAVAAGLDIILHGATAELDTGDIVKAVEDGTLPMSRIDDVIARYLRLVLWLREAREKTAFTYDQQKLLKTAYDTVVDGMVLLKNDGVLPLRGVRSAALFGRRAAETMECGGGSTYITTPLHSNIRDEMEKSGIVITDMDHADAVIFAAGAEGGENVDRPNMLLDKEDEDLILPTLKAAKEQGRKTVVVLNVAGPVDMRPWLAYADAVLVNFIPGCMGGKATVDVMLGKEAPGGRLPMTFPMKLQDSPAAPYMVGERDDVYYGEGIFVGYRWYDYKEIPVQYPFGYGLSYTRFETVPVEIPESWDLLKNDTLTVKVRVKNAGGRAGSEVIQLYLGMKDQRIPMPVKALKAYAKVRLQPGEEKEVALTVQKEDLAVYDPDHGKLIPVGEGVLSLGTSSRDIFSETRLTLTGKNPYVLGEHSTLGDIMNNPAAMAVLERFLPGMSGRINGMTEDMKKFMAPEEIGPLLSGQMIHFISDAAQLQGVLNMIYDALAKVPVE